MDQPKIQLSTEEMELLQNSGWILTKHGIIEKVYALFGLLAADMQQWIADSGDSIPVEVKESSAKISKGEQYERLPYVVLDYPRCFGKEDVLAIRTFFWWGNYFSITLHLKGKFLHEYSSMLHRKLSEGSFAGWYLSGDGDEWNFDLSKAALVDDRDVSAFAAAPADFIKLSYRIEFRDWDKAGGKMLAAFYRLTELIKA